MVDPRILCQRHLLGEHVELHMIAGAARKGRWATLEGLAKAGLIETGALIVRHDEIAAEMLARKMNHQTPLEQSPDRLIGHVNPTASLALLLSRCEACRQRKERLGND